MYGRAGSILKLAALLERGEHVKWTKAEQLQPHRLGERYGVLASMRQAAKDRAPGAICWVPINHRTTNSLLNCAARWHASGELELADIPTESRPANLVDARAALQSAVAQLGNAASGAAAAATSARAAGLTEVADDIASLAERIKTLGLDAWWCNAAAEDAGI